MKIKKFKKTISRLTVLLNTMDDNEKLSNLEKDLIRKHLLDLYDMTLENTDTEKEEEKVKGVSVSSVYDEVFEEPVIAKPEKIQQTEAPIRQLEEEEHTDPELVLVKTEAYQTKQVVEEPILESSKPLTTGARKQLINEEHADILDYDSETNELSDRLGESPVSDLTKAMGINERILTVNELFDGDNTAFKTSLSALNDMANYEDAKSYISAQLIEQYNWVSPKKRKKAKVFIKLVKRRFN